MRWAFWRRGGTAAAPSTPDTGPAPEVWTGAAANGRAWAKLPAFETTIRLRPPVLVQVLRAPAVAGTRSMIHRMPKRRSARPGAADFTGVAGYADDLEIPSGLVEGLVAVNATPAPEPPATVAEHTALVEQTAVAEAPTPVRVVRVLDAPVAHPVLTTAADEYVGAPAEPETPFRSVTEFERLMKQYNDDAGEFDLSSMLGFSSSAAPPPMPDEAPPPPVAAPEQVLRRPTLGQSRKLGLRGTPVAAADSPGTPPEPIPIEVAPIEVAPIEVAPIEVDAETLAAPVIDVVSELIAEDPVAPVQRTRAPSHPEPAAELPARAAELPQVPVVPQPIRPAEPAPEPLQGVAPEARAAVAPQPSVRPRRLGLGAPLRPSTSEQHAHLPGPMRQPEPRRSSGPAVPGAPQRDRPGEPDDPEHDQRVSPALVHPVRTPPSPQPIEPPQPHSEPDPPEPGPLVAVHEAPPTFAEPVYRAPLDTLPPPVDPAQQTWYETAQQVVPAELVSAFMTTFGVDVAAVPVHRGRSVSRQARALGARAFTRAGQVYLPDEAGELTGPQAKPLLAHELVHAAQQQLLGGALPVPESAEGHELEEAAANAERWIRGESAPPVTLVHRNAPVLQGPSPQAPQAAGAAPDVVQLAESDALSALLEVVQTPGEQEPVSTLASWSADPAEAPIPLPQKVSAPPMSIVEQTAPGTDQALLDRLAGLDDAVRAVASREQPPALDLTDRRALDDLADRLYGRLRTRLRAELLVDRERAGVLADRR